jgi:hypothetical protein
VARSSDVSRGRPEIAALSAWLATAASTGDARQALVAAAEAIAGDPWNVVRVGGVLARARAAVAARDLGLTADLIEVAPDAPSAVARLESGAPYPAADRAGRRARGAYDTPSELARRTVAAAIAAASRSRDGIDPACGSGAFLVALQEAGVRDVFGADVDPVVLEVARIACPAARLEVADAFHDGERHDLVVGNPPFVPPERQDKALRAWVRGRFPWLHGRFDLVVPFAASAVARAVDGGGVSLVLPAPLLVQPYGTALRRQWVERHRITEIEPSVPFAGVSVHVAIVALQAGRGPARLPGGGIEATELLRLPNVPLDPDLRPGDALLADRMRSVSVPLGDLCVVDTGLVAHGSDGGKERLLHDSSGPGRVPYADARGFFAGRFRWLSYEPERMHRAKTPALFTQPKVVLQRLRGRIPIRAAIDRSGIYLGHTCIVAVPKDARIDVDRVLALVTSPLVDGMLRIECGQRLDLYPRDVASIPVPRRWLAAPDLPLADAWGLTGAEVESLMRRSARDGRRAA